MNIYVIILNYNGYADTIACVRSLQRGGYPHTIVVVDNGSSDDSVLHFKKEIPEVTLIETGRNLGYAGGNNVGIRYALELGAEAICILNNDTIVDAECLCGFVEISKKYPRAVLGGRIYQFQKPDHFQQFAGHWNSKKGKFINQPRVLLDDQKSWEEVVSFDFVSGCALYVPAAIFKEVGLFEESFFLYYEEIDWCMRVGRKGYQCLYCPTAKLWHKESASFQEPRPPQSYYQWRNRIFFVKRNFSRKEYIRWLITKLLYRTLVLILKKTYKDLEYVFSKPSQQKRISRKAYRASLAGIKDYFLGKMGHGPSWIY